ncbi:MAG: hypothetical protein QOJ00_618 [Actinomycetota bacterium]
MNRRRALIVTGAVLASLTAACTSGGGNHTATPAAATSASGAPKLAIDTTATGMKVGLVVSSSGPGADVRDLASGAYVAAFRLNGAKSGTDHVQLVVKDDNGTPEGATAAINELHDAGVVGVVYGSTGEQTLAAAATAAGAGLPVVFPYADDSRVTAQGATSFLGAPTVDQVAKQFAEHITKANLGTVALLRQSGAYGDEGKAALAAAGVNVALDQPFAAGDALAATAKAVAAAKPGAVIVWAEAAPAVAAADALSTAGVEATLLFADRAAVPAFGKLVAGALTPPVSDGVLSVGSWAGPDTPTKAVDAFFLARDAVVADGATTADLSSADFRSHDAVLALVAAATASSSPAGVTDAMRDLSPDIAGAAGVPLDFHNAAAVADKDVALLSYSTADDGSGRYLPKTSGGHWLAVTGTYELPDALKGLDNPYGG